MANDKRMKRLLITGSREWSDVDVMVNALIPYAEEGGWILVHGACPSGADALADHLWTSWGGKVERHPANWKLGTRAGIIRNADMVKLGADQCLAFRVNYSRGTTHCANLATMSGIPTTWYTEDEDE